MPTPYHPGSTPTVNLRREAVTILISMAVYLPLHLIFHALGEAMGVDPLSLGMFLGIVCAYVVETTHDVRDRKHKATA